MPALRKPMPPEFPTVAAHMANADLVARYGVSPSLIQRWRRRTGVKGNQGRRTPRPESRRPVPADFAEMAAKLGQIELRAHYHANWRALDRWFEATGVPKLLKTGGGKPKREIPPSLAACAREMGICALARHFRAQPRTIRRWLDALGVEAYKRPPKQRPAPSDYRRRPVAQKRAFKLPGRPAIDHVHRDTSIEGRAADFLRRYASVYRCDAKGRMSPQGGLWRYGNIVLTAAELIERARRKGFETDGWAEIAAVVKKPQSSRDAPAPAGA